MCGSYIESARLSVVAAGRKKFRRFLQSMFYIGCIGFGGGSALIPIIEQEIAEKQGLDAKQNIDKDVVVASITPGALPVEIAASIGRRGFGRKGSCDDGAAGDGADSSSCDHSFGLSGTDSQCGTNGFGCCFGIYHIYAYGVYPEYVKVLRGERKKQKTKSGGFDAGHFCVVFFCIYHAGAGACLFWNLFHEGKLLSQKYVIAGNHFSNVFIYQ